MSLKKNITQEYWAKIRDAHRTCLKSVDLDLDNLTMAEAQEFIDTPFAIDPRESYNDSDIVAYFIFRIGFFKITVGVCLLDKSIMFIDKMDTWNK